jgi:glutamate carboxypeptidase
MKSYLSHYEKLIGQMAWRLSALVELESPTDDKAAVDTLGASLAAWADDHGAQVQVHRQHVVGDFIEARWNADLPGPPLLFLCHMDTVHPLGSVEKRPTRIEDEVLYGVGAYDMKASFVILQTIIEELPKLGQFPARPIMALFTSDEEIGSPYSRPLIEKLACQAELALVMEFCNYQESIVTARKGVGIFQITALGREAHSGSNPEGGVNAIAALAPQVERVMALARPELGTSINPAIMRGGTRHNVIPGECDLVISARVKYHSEAHRLEQELEALTETAPRPDGAELILTGEFMRPPMERDDRMIATYERLKAITGAQLGEEARGGGSDGCFSAALGIPTLDGLGASGEGAHAEHEQVYLPSLANRAALLSLLLGAW